MSPISIAKAIGVPGSLGFLVLSCVVGFVLLFVSRKAATVGRAWLLGTLLLYIVLGFPPVAQTIIDGLPAAPPADLSKVGRLDELIVLGGDNEDGRVGEALDAWRTLKPAVVVVLADAGLAQRLTDAGVPATRIDQDNAAATTRAQMDRIATELRARPVGAAGLIASRLQMPRVIALARTYELRLLFLPSPLDHNLATSGIWSVIPSYRALEVSRDALYERIALSYYRSRGWIQAEP